MEPTSSGTAAGILGWKLIGGLAGLGAIGAALAAVVVMCLTEPRTRKEWVVSLISTVMASIGGGAFVIVYFGLQHLAYDPFGLVAMFGLSFACGLPGWLLVRLLFNYFRKVQDRDIIEVARELNRLRQAP